MDYEMMKALMETSRERSAPKSKSFPGRIPGRIGNTGITYKKNGWQLSGG